MSSGKDYKDIWSIHFQFTHFYGSSGDICFSERNVPSSLWYCRIYEDVFSNIYHRKGSKYHSEDVIGLEGRIVSYSYNHWEKARSPSLSTTLRPYQYARNCHRWSHVYQKIRLRIGGIIALKYSRLWCPYTPSLSRSLIRSAQQIVL